MDNNLLDEFENQNYKTTIYSEASNATAFTDIIKNPEVDFRYLYPCGTSTPKSRAYCMRRRLNKIFNSYLLNKYCKFEEKKFYPAHPSYLNQLKSNESKILFTTNSHLPNERELLSAAHQLNIPTIGFIKSWDNVHKGIHSRPNKIAVWNDINKGLMLRDRKDNKAVQKPKQDVIKDIGKQQYVH